MINDSGIAPDVHGPLGVTSSQRLTQGNGLAPAVQMRVEELPHEALVVGAQQLAPAPRGERDRSALVRLGDRAELSREEARIIADRVVPPFALSYGLTDPVAEQLTATVSAALFACFAAHTLGSGAPAASLRNVCSQAVAEAAAVLVGADLARDLATRIDADLAESPAGR